MKITGLEVLHCDAAWRSYSFVKITTDEGLVGWSEYNEGWGYGGISTVIESFAAHVIGQDPRKVGAISGRLHAISRASRGGVLHGAVAAIENALLDIQGKALGVPVHALFGGKVRDRILTYWTHCATYRARHPELMDKPPLRTLDDLVKLGEEVRASGYKAFKTNTLAHDGNRYTGALAPGTARGSTFPELNYSDALIGEMQDQLAALRQGAGFDIAMMLDINFNFKTEGFIRVAKATEAAKLAWLELDTYDAKALALIRREAPCPIASCEHLFGRRDFVPYFENYSMDVGIIDVMWNGYLESIKIAMMAEPYEVNVAPHNYYGPLADLISAHFSAVTPNLRIMEIEVDTMPWQHEILTHNPVIEDGYYHVPDRPGWGADVNEEFVRAHPARPPAEYKRLRYGS